MPEAWTGELLMKMHNNGIRRVHVAAELGLTKSYISMMLNGAKSTPGMRERMEAAVDRLIERKKEEIGA